MFCSTFDILFRDDQFAEYDDMVKSTLRDKKKSLEQKHSTSKNIRQKKKLQKQIDEVAELQRRRSDREKYYREVWRTFQLSDHLPLWVDLRADFADDYLDALA